MISFTSSDGVALDGAEIVPGGSIGGVVLVHEYPADLCGFWPYAGYLARRHLAVLDVDLRCFGRSACPDSPAARARPDLDVSAAVTRLRHDGVRRVAVLGASMGGTVGLIAASHRPEPEAVVCLSCHAAFSAVIGGTTVRLDARTAVRRLDRPVFFLAGRTDPHLAAGELQSLYAATSAGGKKIELLDGPQASVHGWDLLPDPTAASGWSPVADQLGGWLVAQLR